MISLEVHLARWRQVIVNYGLLRTNGSPQDLKDRYYSVCRKLIRNRTGDEASKPQLLSNFHFDKGAPPQRHMFPYTLANILYRTRGHAEEVPSKS
jgi:hypothetical protein